MTSKITIRVTGKNIYNFIHRLYSNDIELIYIEYINLNEVLITLYQRDLEKIEQLKTIYEVEICDYHGFIKIGKFISSYKYIILFIISSLSIIFLLSKLVFNIDVITNDKTMANKILLELKNNGLAKYKFKKNYDELQNIKENILNKYKHEIDWIEIENEGTKYIVRYEPRIENKTKEALPYRHIIAKKNAIIYKMDISDGQIVKAKSNYVHKGDVIVSGYIYLNDKIADTVASTGKVYGEVWYTLNIEYPLEYHSEIKTGKTNEVYVFNLLNKDIELFNFDKYKTKKIQRKTLLKNNLLPIKLEKQIQYQTKITDHKYNQTGALKQAIRVGKKKLESKLTANEFVISYKVLEQHITNGILRAKIFYTVCEDITDYQEIDKYVEEKEEE